MSVTVFLSSVYNIVSKLMLCEPMARNQLVLIRFESSDEAPFAFGKQMLGERSRGVNIGHIRSLYEIVPPRFQRLDISAGIVTVSNYNRKT